MTNAEAVGVLGKQAKLKMNQQKLSSAQSRKKSIEAKIEKLQAADKKISGVINDLESYRKSLSKDLKSFESNTFKGDRRDKYNNKVKDIQSEVDKVIAGHNSNKVLIAVEIKKEQFMASDFGSFISQLQSNIENLGSEINSLLK